jgi:hypothetical protein
VKIHGYKTAYLEDLARMGAPRVAQSPCAVLVAVEDADLAVDGPCRAAVAVAVESDGLYEILVAVLDDRLKARAVVCRW